MTLYHDYYEFWSSWLLWSFGLFWVYLHVKLSCARWDYLWWLFILISIIIMIIMLMISMWNSGGSSARCLPVWNCCLLLSPGEIDDCDDWSSSLYDQGILPWQKADLTDPYFSEFCSWRSKRNGKVIIDQDLDIDWEWGLCRRWETWCCNYHCHFHHQHRHDHYHFKNDNLYHHQVPRNFKAMTSRAQKLFRKLLDPEPEKRLQVFHFLEKKMPKGQKAKRLQGISFPGKKMPKGQKAAGIS